MAANIGPTVALRYRSYLRVISYRRYHNVVVYTNQNRTTLSAYLRLQQSLLRFSLRLRCVALWRRTAPQRIAPHPVIANLVGCWPPSRRRTVSVYWSTEPVELTSAVLDGLRMAAVIPVVDFSSLSLSVTDDKLNDVDVQSTADQIINAFTTIGFVYLSNTGFPQQLVPVLVLLSIQPFIVGENVCNNSKQAQQMLR